MSNTVSLERFEKILKPRLGGQYGRAAVLFADYGPALSWDLSIVLMHASACGKTSQALEVLERHYVEYLSLQHPDIRGKLVVGGVNKTERMFVELEALINEPRAVRASAG